MALGCCDLQPRVRQFLVSENTCRVQKGFGFGKLALRPPKYFGQNWDPHAREHFGQSGDPNLAPTCHGSCINQPGLHRRADRILDGIVQSVHQVSGWPRRTRPRHAALQEFQGRRPRGWAFNERVLELCSAGGVGLQDPWNMASEGRCTAFGPSAERVHQFLEGQPVQVPSLGPKRCTTALGGRLTGIQKNYPCLRNKCPETL